MIYYIIMATILFLGYFYHKDAKWYRVCLLLLFAFTGFRNTDLGGTDAYFYKVFFTNVPDIFHVIGYDSAYGIGYTLLNSIVKTFTSDYLIYQIVYTGVILLLLNEVIKRLNMKYNEQCLFLFVYFCYRYIWSSFVTLRQNIANLIIWLIVLIFYDIKKKKYLKAEVGVGISCLFHSTSVFNTIFILVYDYIKKTPLKIRMVGTIILSIAIAFFSKPFVTVILNVVVKYAGNRYLGYSDSIQLTDINLMNFTIRLAMVILIGVFFEKIRYEKKEEIYNASIVATLLGSIRVALATRFYEYFAIGLYGSFVMLLRALDRRSKIIYLLFLYAAMMAILVRFLLITDDGLYLNYGWEIF